jgi:hypothetical protein
MARSVDQLSKDKVYLSTYGQERKVLLNHKSESPVSSSDRLKHLVNASGKGRRDTLLKLTDEEGTNVT